jgi:hypothetical protein
MDKKDKVVLKKLEQKILNDLNDLKDNLHRFLIVKKMVSKHLFLKKIAEDIKKLNEDAILAENIRSIETTGNLIYNLLNTPWGAPFSADKTLLEAAVTFDYQNPRHSDLYYLLEQFTNYSSHLENEFLTIFGTLYNTISQED